MLAGPAWLQWLGKHVRRLALETEKLLKYACPYEVDDNFSTFIQKLRNQHVSNHFDRVPNPLQEWMRILGSTINACSNASLFIQLF